MWRDRKALFLLLFPETEQGSLELTRSVRVAVSYGFAGAAAGAAAAAPPSLGVER
jgi:hypothetical protein